MATRRASVPKAEALSEDGTRADAGGVPPRVVWAAILFVLVLGCVLILNVNRWYIGPPVLFLWMGWLGVVLTARFLWNAAMSASDDPVEDEEFWRPTGPKDELAIEKRSLLKAIKEIEFDHQMGKMSEADARALTVMYRKRAIEIIKALDEDGDDGLSIHEQIEREVNARLEVAKVSDKAKAKAKPAEDKPDDATSVREPDTAESDDEASEQGEVQS